MQLGQLLFGNQPDLGEHLHMRQRAEDIPGRQVGIEFAVLPYGEGFDLLVEGVGFLPEFHNVAAKWSWKYKVFNLVSIPFR